MTPGISQQVQLVTGRTAVLIVGIRVATTKAGASRKGVALAHPCRRKAICVLGKPIHPYL